LHKGANLITLTHDHGHDYQMDKIKVIGGNKLFGEIAISGAKNAALPILAASLLTASPLEISNIPDLHDIKSMASLLQHHGAEVSFSGLSNETGSLNRTVTINAQKITNFTAPYDIVRKMRASFLVIGPLIARFGQATVSLPGGCAIGTRPINLHLEVLEKMGATAEVNNGYIHAYIKGRLKGTEIIFNTVSVGATETAMMAASLADGVTIIKNAAKEPEIVDLANFLNAMGGKIEGAGSDTITITGVTELHSAKHILIADRIEAGTYAIATAITGGKVKINHINPETISSVLYNLENIGVRIDRATDSFTVSRSDKILPTKISTAPYPSFPTDMQAQFMALLCLADGVSHIEETIWENRFMHVAELNRMGANIVTNHNMAIINGISRFRGAEVMATDLRASVSLVIAALVATGETLIHRVYHLDRGYDHLEAKLKACGAQIERVAA
jgi:UDP-N-acetylglucosamine 1-carboxyvinyltransferase